MNDIATEIAEQYKRQKQGTAGTAALTLELQEKRGDVKVPV
jgi:hypothetical protein